MLFYSPFYYGNTIQNLKKMISTSTYMALMLIFYYILWLLSLHKIKCISQFSRHSFSIFLHYLHRYTHTYTPRVHAVRNGFSFLENERSHWRLDTYKYTQRNNGEVSRFKMQFLHNFFLLFFSEWNGFSNHDSDIFRKKI